MITDCSFNNFVFDGDVDQSVTGSPPSEKMELSPLTSVQSKRCEASSHRFWPMFVVFIGFFLMLCLRGHSSVKSMEKGKVLRRLANGDDGDDEIPLPPSPVLRDLCTAIGPWAPSDSLAAQFSASPATVGDFFMDLTAAQVRASPQIVEDFFVSIESDANSATTLPGSEIKGVTSTAPKTQEQEGLNTTLSALPDAEVSLKQ